MNKKNKTSHFAFPELKRKKKNGYRSSAICLDPERVFNTCLEETGATVEELRGPRGNESIAWMRHIVHYFLDRYCPQYSHCELLKITGKKSNNAIVNSTCQVQNRCDVEQDFKEIIKRLALKVEGMNDEQKTK